MHPTDITIHEVGLDVDGDMEITVTLDGVTRRIRHERHGDYCDLMVLDGPHIDSEGEGEDTYNLLTEAIHDCWTMHRKVMHAFRFTMAKAATQQIRTSPEGLLLYSRLDECEETPR